MDIRNILWGLAFVIVTSCTDNVTPDLNEVLEIRQTVDVNNSNTRSYAEALAIAQNSISILDNHKNGTRGFVRKARTLNTSDYVNGNETI